MTSSSSNERSADITQILRGDGDGISEDLLPLVYEELKRVAVAQMSKEAPGHTLQPTALVHEAYLRLVGGEQLSWDSRAHFFGAAARSMRQILINRANKKKTKKHGGNVARQEFDEAILTGEPEPEWILAMDLALERLEEIDPRKGKIVMMRYFAGLNVADTAKAMNISEATVKREWQFARAWLHREITKTLS